MEEIVKKLDKIKDKMNFSEIWYFLFGVFTLCFVPVSLSGGNLILHFFLSLFVWPAYLGFYLQYLVHSLIK